MTEQAFDLNIEKVLEHWTVPFAIRSPEPPTPRSTRTAVVTGMFATPGAGCATNISRRTRMRKSAITSRSSASSAWV